MDPQTQDEWSHVSSSRLQEARFIFQADSNSVGSAYMAGYGVECALKACAAASGGVAKSHDLLNLVRSAGLELRSFRSNGWLLSEWSVDWRYLHSPDDLPQTPDECVRAAGSLQGYILKQMERKRKKLQSRGKR